MRFYKQQHRFYAGGDLYARFSNDETVSIPSDRGVESFAPKSSPTLCLAAARYGEVSGAYRTNRDAAVIPGKGATARPRIAVWCRPVRTLKPEPSRRRRREPRSSATPSDTLKQNAERETAVPVEGTSIDNQGHIAVRPCHRTKQLTPTHRTAPWRPETSFSTWRVLWPSPLSR